MRSKQSGMTMIGWLAVIVVAGIFAMAAMRLVPVYVESMEVASVLKTLKVEYDGNRPTSSSLKNSLRTRFQVKDIHSIKHSDVKVTQIRNGAYEVRARYERQTQFLGNVGLVVSVDHKVEISN